KFAPYELGAQSAIIKVYYNNGAVVYLRVQGNKKKIEAKTNLKLNFPNGGETFTPCQDTIITWEGNVKSIHTKAELSYDNGESWQKVDSAITDTLDWKVPTEKTSVNARMRISQNFTKQPPHEFPIGSSVYSVDYNFNSTKAISFIVGSIYEWDLVKLDNSRIEYSLNSRNGGQLPLSAKYISEDRFAAVYSVGNFDTLAVFEVGNTTPIEKIDLSSFNPEQIYTIKDKNEFVILPSFGNYFKVFDSNTLSLKQEVIYQQPITDIGIANDTTLMVVSGLDGKVLVVSTTDFQTKDSMEFYRTPIIEKLNMSPDGKLIGLSSIARANEGRTNSMIWDLETKNIITSVNISGSDPVEIGFSPTGNMAIFAYQYQNQINIYDLVKGLQSGIIETFSDAMQSLAYSSVNNSFLVSSVGGGNFKMKQYFFTFPETDISDSTFRIINPIVEKAPFVFGDEYIFNDEKKSFNVEFCNKGEVPLFIEEAQFKYQVHFGVENFALPDTLMPGECIDISIIFNPKDTSIVSDSLIFSSCNLDYAVYVTGNGLNRNIIFNNSILEFGEVCIQDTAYITDKIFTNGDPVPLRFNKFKADSSDIFSFENYKQDTVLAPGESITATVIVVPNIVGTITSDYYVLHSDQEKYKAAAQLRVQGIGTYVEIS
ncbi:MAG: WD40 repeat domain-containing protein, partial [Candidatus Kapaibacterium sp.]